MLDRPDAPRGPLGISDVHKNGCTLDWKPPDDDGGAPIDRYTVEKQDMATGRWTTVNDTVFFYSAIIIIVQCGDASGTQLKINDLTPGHEYKFRVKAVNRYGESDPLDAGEPIVAKDPFGSLVDRVVHRQVGDVTDVADRPGTPDILDWDKDHVDIKWTPPTNVSKKC